MTNTQIKCFLTACKTLNFTKTAQQLHYTPQAVSKLITTLEEELDLILFERGCSGRQLKLTAAGRYCMDCLARNQNRLSRTIGDIHGWYRRIAQRLRLGISEWVEPYGDDLCRVMCEFRKAEPEVEFSAAMDSNAKLLDSLICGELDAVICSGSQLVLNREFEVIPLAREQISLVVPEWVCGKEWTGDFDPTCWGVPYIQSPVQAWGRVESEQVIRKELAAMGIFPSEVRMLPNVMSLRGALLMTPCATVTDTRFGAMARLPNLRYFPVKTIDEPLLCYIRYLKNENPRVHQFAAFARETLKKCEQSRKAGPNKTAEFF